MNFFKNLIADKLAIKKSIRYQSQENFIDYLNLLGYIGKIDEIYFSLKLVDRVFIENNQDNLSDNSVFKNLNSLISDIEDKDKYGLKNIIIENCYNDFELYQFFNKFFLSLKPDIANHEQNFVLNFLLNLVLHRNLLDDQLAIKLVEYYWKAKNCNNYRKDFCIFSIVDSFLLNNQSKFWALRQQFYNHIQKVYSQIYRSSFLNKEESILYQKIINICIKNRNKLKSKSKNRIAVCISGLYRNHIDALQSIKDKIVDPLHADVFIHSWNKKAIWTGFGGTPSYDRVFGRDSSNFIPKEIYNLNKLKEFMPSVFDTISEPIYVDWEGEEFLKILKPKKMIIENQEKFELKFSDEQDFKLARGSLNQIKMFYGLKQSFDMALDFDEYDYIIRIRPDILVTSSIEIFDISSLNNNTIYTGVGDFGLQDFEFVLSSSVAYNFSNFISKMFEFKKLSLFDNFPLYDAHNLMFSWMVDNNYCFGRDLFKRNLLNSAVQRIKIPNLENCLFRDFNNLSEENKAKFLPFKMYLDSNYSI